MEKNNTESKLKKAAKQQMAQPPAFVWDNIEQELQPKESKRKVGFWWIGSGLIAIIIIFVFLTIGKNRSDHNSSESIAEIVNKNNNMASTQPLNTMSNTVNSISENQINKNKIDASQTNQLTANSKKTKNTQAPIVEMIAEQKTELYNLSTTYDKNENPIPTSTITVINIDPSNSTNQENTKNSYDQNITANHAPLSQTTESKSIIQNREQLISLDLASIDLSELVYHRTELLNSDCPKLNEKVKLKPFLEFGILGGLHNISLSKSGNQELYNRRNATENSWYSTGLYTHFGLNFSKNWHVSIGAELIISKDRFESKSEDITKMIVTFDPASGSAIDTNFISGNVYDKADITFHFIDIPINIGYTVSKNKWRYGAELTGLLNIRTLSEGKIHTENEEITAIEEEENIYKTSVGLGIKSSLLFARKLDNNFTVQVRPSFRTYLNTINSENYSLPTRYRLFSVSVGLRKEF